MVPRSRLVSRRAFLGGLVAVASTSLVAACGAPAATPTAAPATPVPAAPKPTTAPTPTPPAPAAAPAPTPTPAPKPAAAAPAKGPVNIVYWVETSDATLLDPIKKYIIGGFEQRYPNTKVELVGYPGSDYRRILPTALAAGTGPDVFNEFGTSYLPPAIDGGHVMPLDDAIKQFGWSNKIWKWALDSGRYKNKIYSVPTAYEGMHLYYNQDLFAKHGWRVPADWAKLIALCKDMKEGKKLIPFVFGVRDRVSRWDWWLSYAFNAYAGNYAVYEALSGKRPWTDGLFAETINRLDQLWQAGYIMDKQTSAMTHDDALGVWSNQQAVMIMEGTWRLRTIGNYAKSFKWEIDKLPMWRDDARWTPAIGIGEVLAVNAKTKHPDESLQFVDRFFWDAKEIGQWMHLVIGLFAPPINMTKADFSPDAPAAVVKAHLDLIESSNKGDFGFLMWTSWPAQTSKFQVENIDAVLLRKMTVKEYLEKSQQLFDKELKEGMVAPVPEPGR